MVTFAKPMPSCLVQNKAQLLANRTVLWVLKKLTQLRVTARIVYFCMLLYLKPMLLITCIDIYLRKPVTFIFLTSGSCAISLGGNLQQYLLHGFAIS